MGWRFRKSIGLGRFVRLNFSRSGVSLGLGPRGASVSIGKRGVRTTVGLPGSGLSHSTLTPWHAVVPRAPAKRSPPPAPDPPTASGGVPWGRMLVILGLLTAGMWGIASQNKGAPPNVASASSSQSAASVPASPVEAPNRPLTVEEVKEAQTLLKAIGFDPGGADGIVGPNTIAAVKRYEPTRHWPVTGSVDLRLLESLRANKPGGVPPPAKAPAPAPAASSSPSVTVVPNEEMRLATRVIRQTEHPCGTVAAAVRLSDGSVRAVCANGEVYRVFPLRGEWLAMKCSAVQRIGVEGC